MYLRFCFFIVILIISPLFVFALQSDANKPIQIEADRATFDQKKLVTVFLGKVVITKGSLVVHADQGIATQDKVGDRTLQLQGSPVTFLQTADDGEVVAGQANQFEYNTKTSLAVLTGRARVKKGKNLIIGNLLTYNTQTQVYSAVGPKLNGIEHKSGGRITVILDGQQNASAASKK